MNIRPSAPLVVAQLCHAGLAPAQAQSVEEFYKGKSITLAIGFTPGGGYDLYARHLARHMGKHIPGRPTIVPQNMAGAGSLRAANFIYSAAPKDGTAFGTFARTTGHQAAAGKRRHLRRHQVHLARQRHQRHLDLRDLAHLEGQHLGELPEIPDHASAAQAPSAEPDIFANLYKNVFGAPIKLVTGYPGTNEITLAMERGEVDGLCGLSWSTIKTRHLQWLKEKKINILVQAALQEGARDRRRAAGHGPDQGHTRSSRSSSSSSPAQEMARPFAAPPGIPARPRRRADRRLRRHHEGPGVSRRRQEVADRRQSRAAAPRSTSCSPSSMPRPRT